MRGVWMAAAVAVAMTLAADARAQTEELASPNPSTAETAADAPPQAPPPAGPDTTIWIDDSGTPRPVVGVTYDEFAKAWRAYQGGNAETNGPRFTLTRLSVDGRQVDGHARFEVTLQIQLHANHRVEAPIGFGGAAPYDLPEGLEAEDSFGYSQQAEAYAVGLSGGGERTIRLSLLAPIRTSGQMNELTLALPRATLSVMRLQLAGRATDVAPLEGALLEVDQTGDGALLTVRGGVGGVRLRWRSPDQAQTAAQTVLDAQGEIVNVVDGGGVKSTARLSVRSFGGEFERFGVRLPLGAKLLPVETVEQDSVRIEPSADGQTCAVLLSEKTTGPVTVELVTKQAIGAAGAASPGAASVNLAGFEVIEAVRQEGYHAVVVDEDTQLRWGELRGARRVAVDELPASLPAAGAGYAVRYFRRDSSIPVEIRPRETRILASPSYHLEILPDTALLHVSTRYQIIGAPVLDFSYDLHDWDELTADPIEPAEHIDTTALDFWSDDGVLDIPLTRPQAGNLTVSFHARTLKLSPDGSTFDFLLPHPRSPAPYTLDRRQLLVTVDPSLRLTIDPRTFETLEPAPTDALLKAPDDPQTFRLRDDAYALLPGQPMRLIGSLTRRAGELRATVGSAATVTIRRGDSSVEQKFDLEIIKQPLGQIEFTLSGPLPPDVEFTFDLLTGARSTNDSPGPADYQALDWTYNPSTGRVVVELPWPWIGPLSLNASYKFPSGEAPLGDGAPLATPLLSVSGAPANDHMVTIHAPGDATLSNTNESTAWRVTESSPGRLMLEGGGGPLSLTRVREVNTVESPPLVGRVWRQSWRRGATLQQRSAWRLSTDQPHVQLELPAGVAPGSVTLRVDGVVVRRPELTPERTLRVPLPPQGDGFHEYTVEARRVERLADENGGALVLSPLGIEADASQAICYWQVILPSDRWLLSAPERLRPAWRIAWRQWRFQRLPDKDAAELEDWVGAAHEDLTPAPSEHAYLYSALTLPTGPWRTATIDRRLAVLAASAAALTLGLILIYSPPRVRNAAVALLFVLVLLAGYWRPADLALVAQAGAIGLVSLFAGWVAMLTLAPRSKPLVTISDDSTSIRRSSAVAGGQISVAGGTMSTNAPTVSLETLPPSP